MSGRSSKIGDLKSVACDACKQKFWVSPDAYLPMTCSNMNCSGKLTEVVPPEKDFTPKPEVRAGVPFAYQLTIDNYVLRLEAPTLEGLQALVNQYQLTEGKPKPSPSDEGPQYDPCDATE